MVIPPFLKSGDTVALVSPSSKIDKHFLKGARQRLEEWGLQVKTGKHADGADGSYAGTLHQRLADMQWAMDSPEVKAIFCSRGGYGAVYLIDKLDFSRFAEHPKWLIGYSDITALHALFLQQGYATLHAPMARHLTVEPADDPCTLYLRELLWGNVPTYVCESHKLNRTGVAHGILRGGNLSVAYGLRATPYDLPAEKSVLFLEDVNERLHSVERMVYNLRLSGVFDRIAGLVVGQFTGYEDNEKSGRALYASLASMCSDYGFPVCFGFPVGHVTRNLPLVNGVPVTLEVGKKEVRLSFHI